MINKSIKRTKTKCFKVFLIQIKFWFIIMVTCLDCFAMNQWFQHFSRIYMQEMLLFPDRPELTFQNKSFWLRLTTVVCYWINTQYRFRIHIPSVHWLIPTYCTHFFSARYYFSKEDNNNNHKKVDWNRTERWTDSLILEKFVWADLCKW